MRLENWQLKIWRLFLRAVRAVTLTVDDWVQAQELKLREPAMRAEAQAEVDPAASAVREKAAKKSRRSEGGRHSQHSRPEPRMRKGAPRLVSRSVRAARLIYQHGQFVRVGGVA